jgi:hypothetical protein
VTAGRGRDHDINSYLLELEERIRRLERGTDRKGTVSVGAMRVGGLIVEEGTQEDGKPQLVIRRLSDGMVCTIDPGNCVVQVESGEFAPGPNDILWAMDGYLLVGVSNKRRFGKAASVDGLHAYLGVAGTTDTVLTVYDGGAAVGTLTVPAGETEALAEIGHDYAAEADYQVGVTAAGRGAMNLQTVAYVTTG